MSAGAAVAWPAEWLAGAAPLATTVWRGVEAQHIVATLSLVDTLAEQSLLEQLLETSKPPLPAGSAGLHYLLNTPFRYRSPYASRFRRAAAPGVWYGAETLRAAATEVAYWRWRFVTASVGLRAETVYTQHSFFTANVQGLAIDLSTPPWSRQRELWTHDSDYTQPQALADAARAAGLAWLRYESVREAAAHNAAVFKPSALSVDLPVAPQTWHCKASASNVTLQRDSERYAWSFQNT